jgi:predicted RNase H-like HicB family nuclease
VTNRYSMVIRWSEEDQVFVVSLPEFGNYAQTHGETYEEAAQSGREVLELLVESFQAKGQALPSPCLYEDSMATQKPSEASVG